MRPHVRGYLMTPDDYDIDAASERTSDILEGAEAR